MGMFTEFRAFIARGNVIDLAVGVIIGGAFATITKSLTDDLIMPAVGYLFGGVDFSGYFIQLAATPASYTGSPLDYAALKAAGVPMLGIGQFVTVSLNFLILAFIIFLFVRGVNRIVASVEQEKKEGTAPPAAEAADVALLREILEELKAQRTPK